VKSASVQKGPQRDSSLTNPSQENCHLQGVQNNNLNRIKEKFKLKNGKKGKKPKGESRKKKKEQRPPDVKLPTKKKGPGSQKRGKKQKAKRRTRTPYNLRKASTSRA